MQSTDPETTLTKYTIFPPHLITIFNGKNVIDIQSAQKYSVALCGIDNEEYVIIMQHWSRLYLLHDDIINIILLFLKLTTVFATTGKELSGNGHPKDPDQADVDHGWKEVAFFRDKNINITKIAVSLLHTLFLDNTGCVWCCGESMLD